MPDLKRVAADVDGTFVRSDYTYDKPRFARLLARAALWWPAAINITSCATCSPSTGTPFPMWRRTAPWSPWNSFSPTNDQRIKRQTPPPSLGQRGRLGDTG